jgi:hypothetical protein
MTTISRSLPSIRSQAGTPFSRPHLIEKSRPATSGGGLRNLSTRISLAVLATGFNLLGLLALLHRSPEDSTGGPGLETGYCVIGSLTSILAGAVFMLAGWIYWSRPSDSDP